MATVLSLVKFVFWLRERINVKSVCRHYLMFPKFLLPWIRAADPVINSGEARRFRVRGHGEHVGYEPVRRSGGRAPSGLQGQSPRSGAKLLEAEQLLEITDSNSIRKNIC